MVPVSTTRASRSDRSERADRPFRSIEELRLVKDVTPEIFRKIEKYITVYGDNGPWLINLNTAPEPVLRVIGISIGMADDNAERLSQRIVEWRAGPDKKPGTEDDLILTSADIGVLEQRFPDLTVLLQANLIPTFKNFFKSSSSYYRIESAGTVGGVRKKLTAVLAKKDNKGQPKFVYYHQQ